MPYVILLAQNLHYIEADILAHARNSKRQTLGP